MPSRQAAGDLALLALAVAVGRVGVGLHLDQVDDALELALGAKWKLDRNGGAAEKGLDAFERTVEAGAFAIELINYDGAGKIVTVRDIPNFFRLHFHSGHAIHQHHCRIGGHQRGPSVVDEDVEARRIEQIDLVLFPFDVGQGGGDGDLALHFLFVEIGNRVALVDARQAIGSARRIEQRGGERCLTGMPVAHHTDVPNVLAFVNFHGLHLGYSGYRNWILSHGRDRSMTVERQVAALKRLTGRLSACAT